LTNDEALALAAAARVGRIATVRPDGSPHVVPFVFALVTEDGIVRVYWAVDDKPKRSARLARIDNLRANPAVEIVVDAYEDDWTRLWWVRLRGTGRVVEQEAERASAIRALAHKYPAYRAHPPEADVVAIDVAEVRSWSAAGKV
jgi:PPOX class probable F420-dependent enzyme